MYNGEFDHIIEKMNCSREEAIEKIKNVKISFNKATNITTLIDIANTIAQNYSMMEWHMFYAKDSNFLTSDNPLFLNKTIKYFNIFKCKTIYNRE